MSKYELGEIVCANCGGPIERHDCARRKPTRAEIRAEGAAAERKKFLAWIEEERARWNTESGWYAGIANGVLDRLTARVKEG